MHLYKGRCREMRVLNKKLRDISRDIKNKLYIPLGESYCRMEGDLRREKRLKGELRGQWIR